MAAMVYTTRYSEVARRGVRAKVRHAAISALGQIERWTGRQERALGRNRVQIVYLHHLYDDELANFHDLLRRLSRHFAFIPYSQAIERIVAGKFPEPSLTFTFDDGTRSGLAAAEILSEVGASACFFLCPSIVGETDPEKLDAFCRGRLFTPPVPFMAWRDVEALLKAGHEIGGHTQTHANLGALSGAALDEEIGGSFQALAARVGPVRHFAWPFGQWRDFSAEARDAVFRAGYESCASGMRGCHVAAATGGAKGLCVRRDHVVAGWPTEHVLYFMARASASATEETNRWPAEYPTR